MSQVSGELSDGKGMGKLTYTSADWYEQRKSWLAQGAYQEKERIIKLWQQEMACKCEDPMNHLAALIKGANK